MTTALPHLFKTIIDHDSIRPNPLAKVVSLETWRAWRTYRNDLSRAARAFIKSQRGNQK